MFMVRSAVALGAGSSLVILGLGALGALLGLLFGTLLASVLLSWRQWHGSRLKQSDPGLVRQLLAYGLPLAATFALGSLVGTGDRFLIAALLDEAAAGVYAAGYDVAQQTLGMLLMIVNLAAYPLVVRALEQSGLDDARQQLRWNFSILLVIGLPATAGMIVLAPNIAQVVLGLGFRAAAVVLIPWVAAGALISGVKSYYLDLAFQLGHRTAIQIWISLFAALTNLVLNLLWIPAHGIVGAAYASVASASLGLVASWAWGRRVFPLPGVPPETLKVAAATAAMAGGLLLMGRATGLRALAVQVVGGAAVYGAMLLVLDLKGVRTRIMRRLLL
jgi:O-antigen/teichoic acid export membrane protein